MENNTTFSLLIYIYSNLVHLIHILPSIKNKLHKQVTSTQGVSSIKLHFSLIQSPTCERCKKTKLFVKHYKPPIVEKIEPNFKIDGSSSSHIMNTQILVSKFKK